MNKRVGEVKVYWGGMCSGKTTNLIYDLLSAGDGAICFKPKVDTRAGDGVIRTHSGIEFPVKTIASASQIFLFLTRDITTVGIEEASLFGDDPTLIPTVTSLRDMGLDVIVTGLDRTSEDEPFYHMPMLATIADEAIKLRAWCHDCGKPASVSYYTGDSKDSAIRVGGKESYLPLCRTCAVKRGWLH